MKQTPDPAAPGKKWMTRRRRIILAGVASLALLIKILLALKTYGTNDVYVYDQFSVWSRYLGVSLYRMDSTFNHPPSMIYVLHFLSWATAAAGVPFSFWIRLPSILADTANLWLVWKMVGEGSGVRSNDRSVFWSLILLACAPTLILISGFHGNTDSVVIFFILLTIYLVEHDANIWLAGAAFGLAHCVKVFPLIVAPVILLNLSGRTRKIKFCVAAGAVLVAAWSPFIFQDPQAVIGQVFGYRSVYGNWGLSFLARQLPANKHWAQSLNTDFRLGGAYLALGVVWIVSWRMNWEAVRPRLFCQAGLVFLLFLAVSNGFGVQYLSWLAPWVAELGWAPSAIFYAASGVFLFLVYNFWAQGLPWYLANSLTVGNYPGHFDHAEMICWFSVLVALGVSWRRIGIAAGWKRLLPFPPLAPGWRIAAGLIAACALYAIVPPQLSTPKPPGDKDEGAVRFINADADLELSMRLGKLGRYEDSLHAAQEALALTPDSAEARAAIATAYAEMGRWKEASESAEQSLRLDPGFEAARVVLKLAASKR
jgi:tetratricopeptide (TPR) repeat protein